MKTVTLNRDNRSSMSCPTFYMLRVQPKLQTYIVLPLKELTCQEFYVTNITKYLRFGRYLRSMGPYI